MKKILLILVLLDFGIGIFFGIIGHFYSLLCFPLIAVVRGYIGISTGRKNTSHVFVTTFAGALPFFTGLVIGSYILLLRIPTDAINELITLSALNHAFLLSVWTSVIYFLVYMILGLLSGFLCKEVNTIKNMKKHTVDV